LAYAAKVNKYQDYFLSKNWLQFSKLKSKKSQVLVFALLKPLQLEAEDEYLATYMGVD